MLLPHAVQWGRDAVFTVAMISGPILLVALAIGLTISILQAVTQVHEMTLVFVPKIVGVFVVLTVMSGWMLQRAVDFGRRCFESAAEVDR